MASSLARLALTAISAALLVACGGTTAPTAPPTSQPATTSQPQLRAIRILNAPANVRIGSSASAAAIAEYADGSFVDVTRAATWRSSVAACAVSSDGSISGVSAGTAEITAEFGGVRSGVATVACGFVISIATHENPPTEHVMVPGVQAK